MEIINNSTNATQNQKSFLFLHGYTQNSQIFQKRLKVLTKSFKKVFSEHKFIFPDAPFVLENSDNISEDEIKRGWLYLDINNKINIEEFISKSEINYLGLDESLESLYKIGEDNQNIEVIFSFSQGALMTLFLSILIDKNEIKKYFPNLKCIVLVAAFFHPFPLNEQLKFYLQNFKKVYEGEEIKLEEKINIPCMNIYGETDEFIIPEKSQKVFYLYKDVINYPHKGKHFIPTSKEDINEFINFIKKYISK